MGEILRFVVIFFACTSAAVFNPSSSLAELKIDINTAKENEFTKLVGVGPQTAERIVKCRNQNGPFRSIDDITKAPGIGDLFLKRNRDRLTVTDLYRCGYCGRIFRFEKGSEVVKCSSCARQFPLKSAPHNAEKPKPPPGILQYEEIFLRGGVVPDGELSLHLGDTFRRARKVLGGILREPTSEDAIEEIAQLRVFCVRYSDIGIYLWFLDSHLYDIDCTEKFGGSLVGLRIGESREKVQSRFPKIKSENWNQYFLKFRGKDLRIRFDTSSDTLKHIELFDGKKQKKAMAIMKLPMD